MALTDKAVAALKPKQKRYYVHDEGGLYIEVLPSDRRAGIKSWRFRFQLNGKREKISLGRYPQVSLADARAKKKAVELAIYEGVDPLAEKRAARAKAAEPAAETFGDLAQEWFRRVHRRENKHPEQDEKYLSRDILPVIGRMAPAEIRTKDVWACVEPLIERGHGQAARRVRSVIKRVFDYGESKGTFTVNPANPVKPRHIAKVSSRETRLELPEIRGWLEKVYGSGMSLAMKLTAHFLLLNPNRKSEFIAAERAHINLDTGLWIVPKENSKTKQEMTHQLSRQSLVIVKKLLSIAPRSKWVLASNRSGGRHHYCKTAINNALKSVEGLPRITPHDLRRTTRSGMKRIHVSREVAELCLSHRPRGVEGVYDREDLLEERGAALQRWADHIDSVTGPDRFWWRILGHERG